MQSDHKQVYKFTAQRTGKDENMYKDLGNFVFTAVHAHMRKPSCLIIKLKGVGTWWLRKKRMEIVVRDSPNRLIERARSEFSSEYDYQEYVNKREQYIIFQERLKEYEEYIKLRNELRDIRYEDQVLLEPDKGED